MPFWLGTVVAALIVTVPPAGPVQALSHPSSGWGGNDKGQLGSPSETYANSGPFSHIFFIPAVSTVAASGTGFSLTYDGILFATGSNSAGQLGDGTTTDRHAWAPVKGFESFHTPIVVGLAAGTNHSLALLQDGSVVAWGDNSAGELGDGTTQQRLTPVPVPGLSGVVAIVAADHYSMALKNDGTVAAWGSNSSGQLGDGTMTSRLVPAPVNGLTQVTQIAAGGTHSLALRQDRSVFAWGDNSRGELGDGTTINRLAPVPITGLSSILQVASGGLHSLALRLDGTVAAWGDNTFGQLGDGTRTNRLSPVAVVGVRNVLEVEAGAFHSLAVFNQTEDIAAWGDNESGQLGDGYTHINQPIPVHVFGLQTLGNSAGANHNLAPNNGPFPNTGSLVLNGSSSYAEAAPDPDLNLMEDWTVETWFKDDDPQGFNHDYRQIVMKGDRNANPEAPYFMLVGFNHIIAGVRTGGHDYPLSYDLTAVGLDPNEWQHAAVTFSAAQNRLDLWLNATHVYSLVVPAHSTVGNTLPLEIGRNGPATGKYWLGRLQDLRIWNVARDGAALVNAMQEEFVGAQPGLVANWRFAYQNRPVAPDNAGGHDATLVGGAATQTDLRP